ncbi:MAG: hypothetical protein MSA96_03660 [Treponema porcinum]|uniref:ABC transporter permease n=1 Tax=Treponema porcinum TaxID=261392 RepID=UPI002353EFAB|nr:hypothetical protein [Treponema porcinum]MCI6322806.1 hypothetical protein [Treponema porcinum]MCI7114634.1 hypothetical protein [Treponema porcinum]MCI7533572.1 hypothetical protein [Treponema porcinum]MCI7545862.1 hypothetical protein [Treponema porcinum]
MKKLVLGLMCFMIPACFASPDLEKYLENDLELKKLALEVKKAELSSEETSIDTGINVQISTGTITLAGGADDFNVTLKPSVTATVLVQAVSPAKAAELVSKIEEYCNNLTGTAYSVNVMSMQTMLNQMDEITTTMSVMLSAIAAISLLVGGIGIMNIMIVTVTERRQEIGILIGILVSLIVEGMKGQAFAVSFWACAVSFVFSVFVGIFFGLNPAARAAKLDPVLALSGE